MARFAIRIEVRLQSEVNDPAGVTVADGLQQMGFDGVELVRIGKLIELTLNAGDAGAAHRRAEAMAHQLLANPVIEDYQITVQSA